MDMKTKKNLQRWNRAFLFSGLMLFVMIVFYAIMLPVQAKEDGDAFFIEAKLLTTNADTFDIQVSVENTGKDWEGTVRLMVDEEYQVSTAFDTVISLPEASRKEFLVRVPKNSFDNSYGTINVQLINKKGKMIAEEEFYRLLTGGMDTIAMGILSNNYNDLTYLDMGGSLLYFWGKNYPIRLVELKQNSLKDQLETVQLFVVDNFNTEVFSEEEIDAIEQWVYNGGILIVGTGAYAEEILSGIGDSVLGLECKSIYDPDEVKQYLQEQGYDYDNVYDEWEYPYGDLVNYNIVHMAELNEIKGYQQYMTQYMSGAMTYSAGDGAIGVLRYSLSEIGKMGQDFYQDYTRDEYVFNMLEEIACMASSRYNNQNTNYQNQDIYNRVTRLLRVIGNANSTLNFIILEILVVVYVIFVGPVLYLILKSLKKREMYWIAVPATVLAGILLVFLLGRGFEVVNTKAYSVTVEDLANSGKGKTYLYAYNASHDEWSMKMQKGYEYASELESEYRYREEEQYDYRIIREGDALYLAKNPEQNFEDSYFLLGKEMDSDYAAGTFDADNVWYDLGFSGTVTNNTAFDFSYFAVMAGGSLYVFKGLPAGASADLAQHDCYYSTTDFDDGFNRYQYDYVSDMYRNDDKEDVSDASALGVGIFDVYTKIDTGDVALIGLIEEAENTVDDACNEKAYKCVYQIQ